MSQQILRREGGARLDQFHPSTNVFSVTSAKHFQQIAGWGDENADTEVLRLNRRKKDDGSVQGKGQSANRLLLDHLCTSNDFPGLHVRLTTDRARRFDCPDFAEGQLFVRNLDPPD